MWTWKNSFRWTSLIFRDEFVMLRSYQSIIFLFNGLKRTSDTNSLEAKSLGLIGKIIFWTLSTDVWWDLIKNYARKWVRWRFKYLKGQLKHFLTVGQVELLRNLSLDLNLPFLDQLNFPKIHGNYPKAQFQSSFSQRKCKTINELDDKSLHPNFPLHSSR